MIFTASYSPARWLNVIPMMSASRAASSSMRRPPAPISSGGCGCRNARAMPAGASIA
jgi:hypothetical protein